MLPTAPAFGGANPIEPQNEPGYDPPVKTGLRGSHPGSFEIAHSLRDGTFWESAGKPVDTGETYDLVVVGGAISGLAAAYFFREKTGKSARILILENHDDFGGHAKRNEFHLDGRLQLLNGGTLLIDSPTPYSPEADGLIKKLGIDPPRFEARYTDHKLYRSLGFQSASSTKRHSARIDGWWVPLGVAGTMKRLTAKQGKRTTGRTSWTRRRSPPKSGATSCAYRKLKLTTCQVSLRQRRRQDFRR